MDNMVFNYLSSSSRLVYGAMNLSLLSKSIINFYMPYLKLGGFMLFGLHYYSDVTSFLYNMRSFAHSKTTILQMYNQEYLGIMNQVKLLIMAKKYLKKQNYSTKVSKSTLNLADTSINSSENSSRTNLASIMDQSQTTQNIPDSAVFELEPNYAELRELRKQIVEDVQTSAISGFEKASQKYLDLIFRDHRVHKASLYLINRAIREKSFVKDSRDYGINLINEVIKDRNFQQEIKKSSLQVIKHDDIKQCSIDIIQHIVTHPTVRSYVISMMVEVLTQTEAKDVMVGALAGATLEAVRDPITVTNIGALFNKTAANKEVQDAAKSALVHRNLFDLVTFNIPSSVANFTSQTMDLV